MTARANYSLTIERAGDQRVVALVDLCRSTISITNDAERVIEDLWSRGVLTLGGRVIYRDTEGHWDELRWRDAQFIGFAALGADTLQAALKKLAEKPR